jgi:hypothetical protein
VPLAAAAPFDRLGRTNPNHTRQLNDLAKRHATTEEIVQSLLPTGSSSHKLDLDHQRLSGRFCHSNAIVGNAIMN